MTLRFWGIIPEGMAVSFNEMGGGTEEIIIYNMYMD